MVVLLGPAGAQAWGEARPSPQTLKNPAPTPPTCPRPLPHSPPPYPTPTSPAMQVASRIWCLWGIVVAVPGPTIGGGIPAKPLAMLGPLPIQLNLISLLTAWCLSEVIRYGFFALKELLGEAPYISTWLRCACVRVFVLVCAAHTCFVFCFVIFSCASVWEWVWGGDPATGSSR